MTVSLRLGHVRLTSPMEIHLLPDAIRDRLPELTTVHGQMRDWLRYGDDLLTVVALGASGPIGWAAAHLEERILGVYVAPRRRRERIATELMDSLCASLREAFPDATWSVSTAPGSVGRKFMEWRDARMRRAG